VYHPATAAPAAPLISVVTPVLNGERHLQACIDNVAAQDCPVAEHIVVDGGSSDGTVAILAANAARLPYLSYLTAPDRGQAHAMNRGIALARGVYVSFLNVDDYYQPGVLNRVADIIRDLELPHFLAGNCNVWRDGEGNCSPPPPKSPLTRSRPSRFTEGREPRSPSPPLPR
jgi:glycosyltransferase involved in cell wall biosynthesis